MVQIRADRLTDFVRDIFIKAGCSEAEGGLMGTSLVGANLAGHDSHGVVRVPRYLQWLADGDFVANQTLKVVIDTPSMAVVDGQYGFGQSTGRQAVAIGIEKAKAHGLSAVALRNTGHVGRVGEWAEQAAEAGLVSTHYVNAPASLLVAPYGSIDRRFSTAPYAAGIPRPGKDPIILDFATSVVAEGKVLVASQGGKKLPDYSLVGEDGSISGDPHYLYGDYSEDGARNYREGKGAIRAMGDHKGSGLAFMVELLGGSLTGTGAPEEGRRWSNGMLSIYIDPEKIDPDGFFPKDVERYVSFFKTARPIEQGGEVLHPGEPEMRTRKDRLANGVPISDTTWNAIVRAAKNIGIDDARIAAVTA
ncbi:MAG TPA: Ldh family oxidoreductase [Hyphomicrobiaceae bacterium]|nr:Ldh family oxidoreductase [Hyphomicrobiaceae bacterium]